MKKVANKTYKVSERMNLYIAYSNSNKWAVKVGNDINWLEFIQSGFNTRKQAMNWLMGQTKDFLINNGLEVA